MKRHDTHLVAPSLAHCWQVESATLSNTRSTSLCVHQLHTHGTLLECVSYKYKWPTGCVSLQLSLVPSELLRTVSNVSK
jgi:hypothetical protein